MQVEISGISRTMGVSDKDAMDAAKPVFIQAIKHVFDKASASNAVLMTAVAPGVSVTIRPLGDSKNKDISPIQKLVTSEKLTQTNPKSFSQLASIILGMIKTCPSSIELLGEVMSLHFENGKLNDVSFRMPKDDKEIRLELVTNPSIS